MRLLAGTSGYSYKEWVGPFYPEKTAAPDMLRFYAGRFPTVEINNTFYRMPAAALLARWAEQVPDRFAFTLKAPRRITHIKRLKDAADVTTEFFRRADSLGDKHSMTLFQCPPTLRKDLQRLREFLAALPSGRKAAFEFRHESWNDDEVYDALRERSAAWCTAEEDDGSTPFAGTSADAYLRLRRTQYTDDDLRAWRDRIAAQPFERAWVYFKHEDEALAPRFAARFDELWFEKGAGDRTAAPAPSQPKVDGQP